MLLEKLFSFATDLKEVNLAKDRLRKREKYASLKSNPNLYALQKEKERNNYLLRKENKKILSIKDMTPRAQREQRKKWKENSRTYLKKKEDERKIQTILIENSPAEIDIEENEDHKLIDDPLRIKRP